MATELLCIETHPDKVVIAGNTYTLVSSNKPCKCKGVVDVGIRSDNAIFWEHKQIPAFGSLVRCSICGYSYKYEGVWWLSSSRFAQVGTTDECEQYKTSNSGLMPLTQEV